MRAIRLHDTMSGAVREVTPADGGRIRIYVCGPTVYGPVHIGNARPFVVFSLLRRFLAHEGYTPVLVSNITDINDKIYVAARAGGVPSAELAAEMTARYRADTDAFGLGRPDHEPLASESIEGIIALIGDLVQTEHAYVSSGDVYFSVRSYPDYGELSHRRLDDMDQGEGGDGAERKRDPHDFALWKAHKPDEDTWWDSPWGRGRPGWHIECSAMAEQWLGTGFEIHGGGSDLVFPHHENEAAQTRAARDEPLARLWMHNGMLRLDAEKMSKSLGNVFGLTEAMARYGPETLLTFFCSAHYRGPMEFDEERLDEAAARARGIRNTGRGLVPGSSPAWSGPLRERFFAALADDFNTPEALAAVAAWEREANRAPAGTVGSDDLREMLDVLGLAGLLDAPEAPPPAEVTELADARQRARTDRDFAEADRLRDELRRRGWEVRDSADGPQLLPR